MAYVRSSKFTSSTDNSTSFTAEIPVGYATGDALFFFVIKDSSAGTDPSTPSGWTLLYTDSGGAGSMRSAVFYKENVTAASETNPTTTSSDTDTWSGIIAAIGGVPTSSVIDASSNANLTLTNAESTYTGVTTTVSNALVLHAFFASETYGSLLDKPLIRENNNPGFSGEGVTLYSEQVPSAGASSTGQYFYGSNSNTWYASISIKDGSSGSEITARQDSGGAEVVNLFQAIDTQTWAPTGFPSGLSSNASVTYGTIDIFAGVALAGAIDSADRNVFASMKGVTQNHPRQTSASYSGIRFEMDRSGGGATFDFSGADTVLAFLVYVEALSSTLQLRDRDPLSVGIVVEDDVGAWKAWSLFGNDSTRVMSSLQDGAIILDPSNTADVLDSSGTIDLTSIKYVAFIVRCDEIGTGNLKTYITDLVKLEPMVVVGGTSSNVIDLAYLSKIGEANNLRFVKTSGNASNIFAPFTIGNGTDETHFTVNGKGIGYPAIGSDEVYFGADGFCGFELDASANCVFSLTETTIDGGSEWKWNQSSGLGTQTYTDNTFINCSPLTLDTADYSGTIFRRCDTVTQNGATLDNCIINNTLNGVGAVLDLAGSFTDLDVRNCTVGVEFTTAGTVDLDGIQFSGNTTDLEFSGTGTLNVRLTNGADTPTTTATGGGTINVVTVPAEITFNNLTSANVQIIEDDGTTVASRQTSQTGTLVYQIPDGSTGNWCYVINRAGYDPIIGEVAALGSDVTVDATQTQKLLPDGSVMYQGSTSVLLSVVPLADGSRMNLRIGDGAVSAQAIFDEVEDALDTQDGMTYLCNNESGEVQIALLPTGTFVFIGSNVRVIRDLVGDSNATINAFVQSTDGIVLDASNGSVQFVTPNSDVNIVSVTGTNVTDIDDFKADIASLNDISVDDVWDESIAGHTTLGTMGWYNILSGRILNDTIITGTPTSSSLQLTGGSAVDDFYNDQVFYIVSGAALGQTRVVTGYVGATKTITIDEPLTVTPISGDRIIIQTAHVHSVTQIQSGLATSAEIAALNDISPAQVNAEVDTALNDYDAPKKLDLIIRSGTAQAGASSTITLDTSASSINSFYVNTVVYIKSGTGAGQSRRISGYVGSTKVATVSVAWQTTPNATSVFNIFPRASVNATLNATQTAQLTAIEADTNELQTNQGNWLTATGFATPTNVTDAQAAVQVDIAALNNLSTADIDARLTAYGLPTLTNITAAFTEIKGATWTTGDTLEAISDAIASGSTLTAAQVWGYATREVTGGTIDTNNDMRGTDGANTTTPPTATQIQNAISGTDLEKILKRSGLIPALL